MSTREATDYLHGLRPEGSHNLSTVCPGGNEERIRNAEHYFWYRDMIGRGDSMFGLDHDVYLALLVPLTPVLLAGPGVHAELKVLNNDPSRPTLDEIALGIWGASDGLNDAFSGSTSASQGMYEF